MKSQNGNRPQSNASRQSVNLLIDFGLGKVPPQAIEFEEAVLGAILLEKGALDVVISLLTPECFYKPQNQLIFQAMLSLSYKNEPIDLLMVTEQLRKDEKLEVVGGPYNVTRLTNSVVSSANIENHAKIVYEKFLLRKQIEIYMKAINDCYENSSDAFEVMDKVGLTLSNLQSGKFQKEIKRLDSLLVERVKRLELLRNRSAGELLGVSSGFKELDIYTGGWQAPNLILLAARPSIGKTALALNLARNAASDSKKPTPVAIFSLEMHDGSLVDRFMSSESGINLDFFIKARLDDEQMKNLFYNGIQKLANYPIFIDDTAGLTLFELKSKCRRLKKEFNIGLVIIDYLQLMGEDYDGDRTKNREQQIASISRNLKALAKELGIPIIALSQLSRDNEKAKREPMLSDLRESGALEQDADDVFFLYRPDYQKNDNEVMPEERGLAFIKIAKHRNGPLGVISMHTDLSIQKWFTEDQYRVYNNNKDDKPF